MRIAVDTNILVYAEGVNGPSWRLEARRVLETVSDRHTLVLPMQVLGELFNVLTRRGNMKSDAAGDEVLRWRAFSEPAVTTGAAFQSGLDLAIAHKLTIWDALILAASAEADCDMLLSEDMQEGFVWRSLTVVNPFLTPGSPLLEDALRL